MRKAVLLVLLSLAVETAWAQVFSGNSPSIRWQSLKQQRFSVIFPTDQAAAAQRVAAIIQRINQQNDSSIGSKRKNLPIVLQPETTVSNGYVSLAPFRAEFMMTAPADPFDQGSIPWIDQLALHEYRHAEQYSNFNRGLAKAFYFLLGQQGQAFANALSVPDWFFEGDAVYQETLLSSQGRGRLAGFFNGYKSLWEGNRSYSYAKLRNGSLKDYVPNHYDLGYQLVAYGHEQYGTAFWKNVSNDAAAMKGLFYPWQRAVKKYSGESYSNFVQQALGHNRQVLGVQAQTTPQTTYKEELNPVYTENGHLLFSSASYSQIAAFYEQSEKGLRKIRTRDRTIDNYFSYANGQLLYASFTPSLRWGWKNYSELQLLDITTGRQKTITRKSKYFSAALSPTGDSIITVFIQPGQPPALHLLNKQGQLLRAMPAAEQELFYHPVFAGQKIMVVVRNGRGDMSLVAIDPATATRTTIIDWQKGVIGYPRYANAHIYFTASDQGRDRLFRVSIDGSGLELLPVGNSQTGQYQPAVYGDKLSWMQFTADGMRIQTTDLPAISRLAGTGISLVDPLQLNALSIDQSILAPMVKADNYSIGKYRKSTALLNLHSWLPWFDGEEFSLDFISQNTLNTLQSDLYFGYNRNEGYKKIGLNASWGDWFPIINAGINYTIDRRSYVQGRPVYWNEIEAPIGVQIPLNFSRGKYLRYLTAYSNIVFNKAQFRDRETYGSPSYQYLDHQLVYSNQTQQAVQQFNPAFAQSIRLHYRNAISLFSSNQLLLAGNFYFPGLAKNHSLVLSLAAQGRDSSNGIRFSNEMGIARGYYDENFFRAGKAGVNYAFPLCYPDVGAFQMVYLLRLRANLFYDHSIARDHSMFGNNNWQVYRSAGVELMADTKWWNQLPLSFGIRYARLLDADLPTSSYLGRNRFELIIPVNILPGSINKQPAVMH